MLSARRGGALGLPHHLGEDMHAKRVESLANGVAGVLNAAMLSVHAIGQAYAAMAHIQPRSGVKQLDRLLSNVRVDLKVLFPAWIRFVLGVRTALIVALDWTEFDDDDHVTLCAYAYALHKDRSFECTRRRAFWHA